MERRKLQKVGGGTYTVSVPKEWAESQSVSAGSTIHLYTHVDGSLVVRTERKDSGKLAETRIEVESHDPSAIRAELAGAHEAGFDTVSVEATEPFTEEQRHAVEEASRELVGMEITERDETAVTVRNLLDASDFSVRQSVVQLQFIALAVLRRATRALIEADGDAVEQLRERAAEADRLYDLIEGRFNRSLSSYEELDQLALTRSELFDYYDTAEVLGEIADRSVGIAQVGASLSGSPPGGIAEDFRELSETVLATAEDAVTVMLASDRAGAHDVIDRCEEVAVAIEALDRHLSEEDSFAEHPTDEVALFRALDRLTRIVDGLTDIAAVAIRSERRSEIE